MANILSHEAAAHDAASLPVMLPGKLVGRDMVLARIYAQLKENRAVLIHGSAGSGKTALAAMLASAYTDLPGGVLWLAVNGTPLAELLVQVGRAYGELDIANTETPLGMIGAVANTLTRYKPLMVIDGKIDGQTAEAFVNRCAENLPVLLVTEEALSGDWSDFQLEALAPDQAALMFKNIARMDGADGEENDHDIAALVGTLGYNPFAIAVAAGAVRANKQTPAQFRAALPNQPGVHGQILALTTSFRSLNAALQGLMLMLGATINGQGSSEMLSLISGAPPETIVQAMNLLAMRQLVEQFSRYDKPYYRLHPITYTFTQPLLRGSGKLDELREKVRRAAIDYVRRYSSDADQLAIEMDSLLAVARWAVNQGDRDTPNELAVALMQAGDFISERGYVYELLTLRRMAASSVSAFPAYGETAPAALPYDDDLEDIEEVPLEDEEDYEDYKDEDFEEDSEDEDEPEPIEYVTVPLPMSSALQDEDEPFEDEAVENEPITVILPSAPASAPPPPGVAAVPGEPAGIAPLRAMLARATSQSQQAAVLSQIGAAQMSAGLDEAAQDTFNEALTLYDALNDTAGQMSSLLALTRLAINTDDAQEAALQALRGSEIADDASDAAQRLQFLLLLGDSYQQLGESGDAVDAYESALGLARSGGDTGKTASALLKLGYAQLDNGEPQAAVRAWEEALPLFRQLDQADNEARVLGGLGTAYGELKRWEESINFHNSALHLARAAGDKDEEALQLSNLGYAATQAGKLGDAVLRYRQALHLAYALDNRDNIVSTIVDLAGLLVRSPRHLAIAELLVDDAVQRDPTDRDVMRLKERIQVEKISAQERGVAQNPVGGTAQEYAALAYQALDE